MPDYLRIGCALPFGWSHSFPCAGTAACSPLKSRASNISQNGDYRLPPAEGPEAYIQGFLIAQEHVRHHDILRKSLERERQSFATNWCSVCRAVLAPANAVWSQSSSLYPPFWLFLSSSSLDIIKASLYYDNSTSPAVRLFNLHSRTLFSWSAHTNHWHFPISPSPTAVLQASVWDDSGLPPILRAALRIYVSFLINM